MNDSDSEEGYDIRQDSEKEEDAEEITYELESLDSYLEETRKEIIIDHIHDQRMYYGNNLAKELQNKMIKAE